MESGGANHTCKKGRQRRVGEAINKAHKHPEKRKQEVENTKNIYIRTAILGNRHDTGMEECVIDRDTQIEHMLYAHPPTKKRDTEPLIFSSSVFSFSSCKLTFFFFLCHVLYISHCLMRI